MDKQRTGLSSDILYFLQEVGIPCNISINSWSFILESLTRSYKVSVHFNDYLLCSLTNSLFVFVLFVFKKKKKITLPLFGKNHRYIVMSRGCIFKLNLFPSINTVESSAHKSFAQSIFKTTWQCNLT